MTCKTGPTRMWGRGKGGRVPSPCWLPSPAHLMPSPLFSLHTVLFSLGSTQAPLKQDPSPWHRWASALFPVSTLLTSDGWFSHTDNQFFSSPDTAVRFSSDTICLELASDPADVRGQSHKTAHTSCPSLKYGVPRVHKLLSWLQS